MACKPSSISRKRADPIAIMRLRPIADSYE
jgi:hypothetical protein